MQDVEAGDYFVTLKFYMGEELENVNGVPYKLEVTNSLGSADYSFQLRLHQRPPPRTEGFFAQIKVLLGKLFNILSIKYN